MNLIPATFLLTVNLTYCRCLRSWFQDLFSEWTPGNGTCSLQAWFVNTLVPHISADGSGFIPYLFACSPFFLWSSFLLLKVFAHKASFIRTTISFSKTVTILAFKQNIRGQFTRYEAHICFHWCEWAKHWPKGAISQWLHKFVPKYYLNTAFQGTARANAGTETFSF